MNIIMIVIMIMIQKYEYDYDDYCSSFSYYCDLVLLLLTPEASARERCLLEPELIGCAAGVIRALRVSSVL